MTGLNAENSKDVHPWRRYFARLLDVLLMGTTFYFVLAIFFPKVCQEVLSIVGENKALDLMLTGFFAMLLNPILISLTGTTLGKYIFGIRVQLENSEKLSLLTALKREFLVYMKGLAFCIPLVNIFTLASSHSRLQNQGKTSWDEALNCDIIYRENNLKQKILNITGIVLYILLVLALRLLDSSSLNSEDLNNRSPKSISDSIPYIPASSTVDNSPQDKKSSSDIEKALELYKAKKNGYIGRNKYIELLLSCSDKGNIYCSGVLGNFYYNEEEYKLAYPLLLRAEKMRFGKETIEYNLGYMLAQGYGTAKNEATAINAANLGDPDSAYSLGVLYANKAWLILDQEPQSPEIKYNLIQSYAWYKVSKALGNETAIRSDSQVQDIEVSIENKKSQLIERSALESGNKLAIQICATIKQCKRI